MNNDAINILNICFVINTIEKIVNRTISIPRVEAKGNTGPNTLEPGINDAPMNADNNPTLGFEKFFLAIENSNNEKSGANNSEINDGRIYPIPIVLPIVNNRI